MLCSRKSQESKCIILLNWRRYLREANSCTACMKFSMLVFFFNFNHCDLENYRSYEVGEVGK